MSEAESMIERVARAVAAELGRQDSGEPFKLGADLLLSWLDQNDVDFAAIARAAITAMREPTPKMRQCISDDEDVARARFTSAIDAALSEEGE